MTPMAELPLILALDIGSSSVRAVLYDRAGRAVSDMAAQERYTLRTAADGAAEDDANAALGRAARCIDRLLARAGPLAALIGAVAVDTLVSNILAVDGAGRPLTPLLTYADMRCAGDAAALRAALDEAEVHDRTGCLLRAGYWPAWLAWFRRTQPQIWQAAARWITLGEYLELKLFGRCRVSYSAASWGGLLDRQRLGWDAPLLDLLGIAPGQLSPLADGDEPLAGLAGQYAARWPTLSAVPWFAAVGDGAAANVGSGCTDHERIALTVGTTGALRVIHDEAVAPMAAVAPGLWCYRVDRRHALLGGATSEGGNVYAWVRSVANLGAPAEIEAALAAFPPDGHGLTVLPFLAGERSPGWAGNVRATIGGLSLATTPIAILRAGLEAVAYRLAAIERRLCDRPGCTHRLIAGGSALLSSPAWMQIFADVMGRLVVASGEPETTSRGSALLALHGLGILASFADAPAADGRIFEPDAGRHAVYQAAMARQQALYDRLIASRDR